MQHVAPFVDRSRYSLSDERLRAAVEALRTRLNTYADINDALALIFPTDEAHLEAVRFELRRSEEAMGLLRAVRDALAKLADWSAESAGASVRAVGKELGVRGAALFHPVRLALTGETQGPDLGKILAALGRREALGRLDAMLGARGRRGMV